MKFIVPAVLPSTQTELEDALALFTTIPGVRRVQIDVVDGTFAAPASWPYTAPDELRGMLARGDLLPSLERIGYEIDLMCIDPETAANGWLAFGASRLTVHAESNVDTVRLLRSMQARHGRDTIAYGLAINLATDPLIIDAYIGAIDYVQFMGIARIGRQGQPFDDHVTERVRALHEKYPGLAIQVDGGVSPSTAPHLISAGVSNLIVGSAILHSINPRGIYNDLQKLFP